MSRIRWFFVVIALPIVATLLAVLPLQAETAPEPPVPLSPEETQVAQSINDIRQKAGLPPLAVHPLLVQAARDHIADMIASGHYGHTGSDGSRVARRVIRTGYAVDGWTGEIWAMYQDVPTAIRWWMSDLAHRDSILNASYTEMGIGTRRHPNGRSLIVVVDFTTGSTNQPAGYQVTSAVDSGTASTGVALAVPPAGLRYVVQSGDTLFGIGLRYGLSWQEIAATNGLTEHSLLQLGAVLWLPGNGNTPPPAMPEPTPMAVAQPVAAESGIPQTQVSETAPPSVTEPVAGDTLRYTVQPGDTLYDVAARHGVDWQELAAFNGLALNDLLQIGQKLSILPAGTHADRAGEPSRRYHIVAAGETLIGIAAQYNVDWPALMQVNGLTEESVLQVGQTLQLPQ